MADLHKETVWNVLFDEVVDCEVVTKSYLSFPVDFESAKQWALSFADQYFGKPYPNGRGFYPFYNIRVGLYSGT